MQNADTKLISDSDIGDTEDGEIRDSEDDGDADADYRGERSTISEDLPPGSSLVNQASNNDDVHC